MTFQKSSCEVRIRLHLLQCLLCSSAGSGSESLYWSQRRASSYRTVPTSHISPTINMSSPLADFMTCLKQAKSLPTLVSVVSDNARIANHGAIAHNGYREPARPSRWAAEKKTQISPKFPTRQISPRAPSRRSCISIKCSAPKPPYRQSSTECNPPLPPAKAA
jgi:hypothetical protein